MTKKESKRHPVWRKNTRHECCLQITKERSAVAAKPSQNKNPRSIPSVTLTISRQVKKKEKKKARRSELQKYSGVLSMPKQLFKLLESRAEGTVSGKKERKNRREYQMDPMAVFMVAAVAIVIQSISTSSPSDFIPRRANPSLKSRVFSTSNPKRNNLKSWNLDCAGVLALA